MSQIHTPRRLDFTDARLYAVTPDTTDAPFILSTSEQLLNAGVDVIQLRNRSLNDRLLLELGRKMKAMCEQKGAHFILNNRVDLAMAMDADGVHIGHEDMPLDIVRTFIGHRKIVGVSTHSLPEAILAQKQGADYISCGPIWATPTKPEYSPVGVHLIGLYKAAIRIPFVAIGGIDEKNIDQVIEAGASCVAMVRELYRSANPKSTAKLFLEKLNKNRKEVHSL